MPFTDEERHRWREEKRARERARQAPPWRPAPVAVCVDCQNPFGYNEGTITDEAALCDLCLGD